MVWYDDTEWTFPLLYLVNGRKVVYNIKPVLYYGRKYGRDDYWLSQEFDAVPG